KIPEKFAAIGGTSGPIMGQNSIPSDASNDILPVYLVFGEYDYWPWKVGQLEEGDFLGTMGAAQAGYSLFTQEYWINRNVLGSIDNYEITHQNNLPQNKDNSIMYIVKPNSQVYPGDRYKTFTWFNENGIPLFVWTQSAGRAHNCVVSDLWKLWEDWFSKWIREDEETLLYIESENNVKEVKTKPITKAEFIAKIADYFDWPHPSEYNDIWHPPLKQFNDVKTTDKYGKEIECAYEENLIAPDENGNFNPESTISRQEAAKIFVKAFKLPETDIELNFDDVDEISEDALSSVKTLVGLGYMKGRTQKLFKPNAPIMREEVDEIFNAITNTMVSPVQALPKAYYTAPRRYIKLYCPTPGATIYFTKSVATDLSSLVEPPMPDINNPDQIYTVEDDGHIKEDYPQNEHTYVMYKAVAVKDGMAMSPVQTFVWHLYRPRPENANFGHTLILEKTETSPAVYSIYNDSESVRPMAWYIEGNEKGLLFDALQTNASIKNLKEYIDANIATKPYILVIGHSHIDHVAQIANFVKAGIEVYCNKRGWSSLRSYLPDPADQAKVKNIDEGDVIDMGDFKLHVYALPGHANDNIILQDKENGFIFASDIYGCTRAGSADNVNVSGLRVDLLLSFTQQVYSNYKKDGGKINWLFTGHDETPLKEINLKLFEAALQQVIDNGEAACRPTLRGGNDPAYTRTTMIGDMWKDGTNWIALRLAGKMGDNTEYLSSTTDIQTLPYMSEMADLGGINYNFGGHTKYSVLSNIEIEGGKLVGKTVQWAKTPASFTWAGETITVPPELPNKFNPWSFDYTIEVPEENDTITIIPTTMSTKVKSIKINDQEVGYRSRNTITVTDGQVIEITVVAPDGETTSTYRFIIKKVSNQ
ncbi:S-layer homology domain-containing protein, partial [Thermovenabulum sp.]|uniref:S-layer homology domain-containing protein n=1 Tax=Thermovenabulum sp. TaxID=3100335 RepID=UPI003C7C98A1